MWAYDVMQNALIAGILIGSICGLVSVFVIIRRTAFAAHAISHISITGAAGGVLIGLSAMTGQLIVNIIAGIAMGLMGDKIKKNDMTIGIVLTFFLGLGVYFLFLFQNHSAGGVMSILFGNILAVTQEQIHILLIICAIIIGCFLVIARPLLFASIDPIIAESKNIPIRFLSIVFFIILALTISMACQIVGTMLVFALLVTPGAIAAQLCDGFYKSMLVSVLSANIAIIASLIISYEFNLPTSFCITSLMCLFYFLTYMRNVLVSTPPFITKFIAKKQHN